jgi:hypothetical protein
MSIEKFNGFITKFALTSGVIETELEHNTDYKGMATATKIGWGNHFHGHDWHRTREAAQARIDEMMSKKINSLHRQLAKLKKPVKWKVV